MLAKGPQSPSDPRSADMQSSMRQPQSAQLFANSYSGMAHNRSSDALGAGGLHRLTCSAISLFALSSADLEPRLPSGRPAGSVHP